MCVELKGAYRMRATAEYATAKIAVWWDMKDCPIPKDYDAGLIRQSMEGAFMERGYSGPVSITAYGDQTQTSDLNLQGLFCSRVSVAHTRSESIHYIMYRDMVEWRDQNPPPATMMIISDEVQGVLDWDLLRLQQQTPYNLFLAYSVEPRVGVLLSTSEEWCWKKLLYSNLSRLRAVECAKLFCKSCNFDCQDPKKFKKHLSSYKHVREEDVNPTYDKVVCVTEDWGINYKATPEYATAKIQVWWDMASCPIPEGYDPRRVRPSLEAAFNELGYSGPVSITAYADHKHTPLQALSSTGVDVVHIVPGFYDMCSDVEKWHDNNPPLAAAIMMVISDDVYLYQNLLVDLLQVNKYNLFLAYPFRPSKMSFLLTSAEWLWESLLAVSEKRAAQFLHKCSESGEPTTSTFYCKFCRFSTKCIDHFRTHLSTNEEHAQEGGVDVVCGGPPCQGISGFNRFRNKKEPLKDEKNEQLLQYMKIVDFLKPKYVLMENVVDMLRFVDGFLARYAVGRLVQMNYQTRMGMMAAGSYGLAQFRRRFFLWGARSGERLPQFPLPTHDVVNRGTVPVNFDRNVVAYEERETVKLAEKILLSDVLTDLPVVANNERRAEMPYDRDPETPFQQFIRLTQEAMLASPKDPKSNSRNDVLYDHHSLNLNKDDYQRVCRIPKKKGANFRDLPGVTVTVDNKVEWDPNIPRIYLESNNPLIPKYAMTYVKGTSTKPFGRLWWDETVPTVIGRAEPHNHVIIHPSQDRVLTVRENARLQGFPDYYRLFGPTKEKYIQVGNAVAVPVASALGYALGQAFQGLTTGSDPLFILPEGFPKPTF